MIFDWLVVSTPLKNISQWEGLSHTLWKIKNVPNHQPVMIWGIPILGSGRTWTTWTRTWIESLLRAVR